LQEIQDALGYVFHNPQYLEEALTHASFSNECGLPYTNERLEFLGDAVLQLAVSHYLWKSFPGDTEGDLSRKRASLVCEEALADWAREIGLGKVIRLGKGLEKSRGKENPSVLADAAEAVLGALYLDGGFDRAFDVISRFCRSRESLFFRESRNPKTLLQELLESRGRTRPEYYLVKTEGPDHEPLHTVKVIIDGKTMATAVGKTIREAENRAAEKLLMDLNATDCI